MNVTYAFSYLSDRIKKLWPKRPECFKTSEDHLFSLIFRLQNFPLKPKEKTLLVSEILVESIRLAEQVEGDSVRILSLELTKKERSD